MFKLVLRRWWSLVLFYLWKRVEREEVWLYSECNCSTSFVFFPNSSNKSFNHKKENFLSFHVWHQVCKIKPVGLCTDQQYYCSIFRLKYRLHTKNVQHSWPWARLSGFGIQWWWRESESERAPEEDPERDSSFKQTQFKHDTAVSVLCDRNLLQAIFWRKENVSADMNWTCNLNIENVESNTEIKWVVSKSLSAVKSMKDFLKSQNKW